MSEKREEALELSEWTGERMSRRSERANSVKEQKETKTIEREREKEKDKRAGWREPDDN